MNDLTGFQKNILTVLVGEAKYGLEVKKSLEGYYDGEVNHSRLYPNLDELVERGYVEKRAPDERTNEYVLTDDGHEAIREEILWRVEGYVAGDEERERALIEAIEGG